MFFKINVISENGGTPLGATVTFKDRDGNVITVFDVPETGSVTIDSEFDSRLFEAGVIAEAKAPGYQVTSAPTQNISPESDFVIIKAAPVLLYIGLGALAVAALMSSTGKKVKGFNELPPMAKNGIVLGGLGLIAFFLLKGKGPNKDLPDNAKSELDRLIASGMSPTISEAQASAMSSTIVAAADDCGTDENAIFSAFSQVQNKADVLMLIWRYGIREYKGCFDGDYLDFHSRNLAETVTSELSSGDVGEINAMLSAKGIDFKF